MSLKFCVETALKALVLAIFVTSASATTITPTSVTVSSLANSSYMASNLIDDSGLSTPVNNASILDGAFIHMWLGNATTGTVTFNLGGSYALTAADIWNYNFSGNTNRGTQTFDILTSSDGVNFTPVRTNATLAQGNGFATPNQVINFGADASYVELSILSNWGSSSYVGLGKVKFEGTAASAPSNVPEPYSAALVLTALSGLSILGRRRRGKAST